MAEKITRKQALRSLGTLTLASLVPGALKAAQQANDTDNSALYASLKAAGNNNKPNIVLIIADQLRADACKREGFALDTMPFLDNLATRGTWFNKSYCAAPACVPSRTSMMTGRFPSATHVRSNWNIQDATYKADMVDVVKANGYTTALVGKNHTYLNKTHFDYWMEYNHLAQLGQVSEEVKRVNQYLESTNFYFDPNPAPMPAAMQQPARIVDDSINWINQVAQKADQPFFLYMSIPEPHNPYQVSEPYYSLFPPDSLPPVKAGPEALKKKSAKWQVQRQMMEMGYPHYEKNIPRIRSNYYGMLRLIDDQLKRFMHFMDEKKLTDNTVVIFVADHGDFTGEYGMIKKGVEVPECLTRIPMIWHGPSVTANHQPHSAHVSNIDIMPTICEMIGAPIPDGVQGRSLWPLLSGKVYPKEEFESIIAQQGFGGLHFTTLQEYDPYTQDGNLARGKIEYDELNTWSQSGSMRMLRKGDWKLALDMQGAGQLYQLKIDPSEIDNLFYDPKHASKRAELMSDLMTWELRMQDPLPYPRPGGKRQYGFKRDPHNFWTPYKHDNDSSEEKAKK